MANYYYYKKKINKLKIVKDIIIIYFITIFIVLLFNSILLQAYKVPTNSMEPTLKENTRIIVDKFSIGPKIPLTDVRIFEGSDNLKRGDIIVFMSNEYFHRNSMFRALSTFIYTLTFSAVDMANIVKHYDSNIYLKRVIGVPGDRIKFHLNNNRVTLYINNKPEKDIILSKYTIIEENKNNSKLIASMILQNDYIVKSNEFYVLGDNRISSSDSRLWGGVNKKQIIGKAIIKYWPFDNIGVLQ